MSFLEARGIRKSYTVGETALTVLRDLDLTVEAGEMVAIVGASGVGKSTLLHILGGLDRAEAGTVTIAGIELTTLPDADVVAFRNRQVGFVFQFHHLLPEFSALENAAMPMRIARIRLAEARAPRRGTAAAGRSRRAIDAPAGDALGRRTAARRRGAGPGDASGDSAGRRADRETSTSRPPVRCTICCRRCIGPTV